MRLTLASLAGRLRASDGFTMPVVMGAMLVVMLISVAAIAAANGDVHLTQNDQDDKQALAAAEAGVNDYLGHLNVDSNYWAKCTAVDPPTPVNNLGATGASRKWRTLPGATAQYSIELVPQNGNSSCSTSSPTTSMIDPDGNLKVRVTGRVQGDGPDNYRTINATFRRSGFLDYLYYTNLENQSFAYYKRSIASYVTTRETNSGGTPTGGPDFRTWASGACEKPWYGSDGRGSSSWTGQYQTGTSNGQPTWSGVYTAGTDLACGEIQFVTGDAVNGPFHSNDDILVCGTPSFGTSGGSDRVEVSGSGDGSNGYRSACNGSSPTFNPSLVTRANTVDPPATNAALASYASSAYSFTGPTKIVMNGAANTLTVTNGGSTQTLPWPASGVVYVSNNGCSAGYDPTDSEQFLDSGNTCGDVSLSGSYSKDLTIGAANDIVAVGSVTKVSGSDALLGLIPTGFMRVWHPVTSDCKNASGSQTNPQIDAAILTLKGSFTVDNYWCGDQLGTLTVNGAISQNHRGTVGTGSGGSSNTGYLKNYNYNTTLRYRSPPKFLDPVQTSWRILREGEQSPPAKG